MTAPANDTWSLVASAVAGRVVEVVTGTRGTRYDGARIQVAEPEGPADIAHGDLLHGVIGQATLLAAGSYDAEPTRRLRRAPEPAHRRYLLLELIRARYQADQLLPPSYRRAIDELAGSLPVSGTAEESARRALTTEPLPPPPPWSGELLPRPSRRADGRARTDPGQAAEPDDGSKLADLLSAPFTNPFRKQVKRVLSDKKASSGSGAGKESPPGTWPHGLRTPAAPPHASAVVLDVGGQPVHGHVYPEWDQGRQRYRERWCTVAEFAPASVDDVSLTGKGPDPSLLRALARIGLAPRTHSGEEYGDEIDLQGLIGHHVDLRRGHHNGVPRVYRARRRTRRDLAVIVLLDATGSASDQLAGSSLFAAHRLLAGELTSALEAAGARVATHAFYSRGRHNVRLLHCKSYDERWGLAAQRRLSGVVPGGFTRLGAVLRHGTQDLMAQGHASHRLLVVVGDGVAYDDGYEDAYAVEDCRRAVDEAAGRAVACVGVSAVATPGTKSIWDASARRVTPDVPALARAIPDLLNGALARAGRPSIP